MFNYGPKIVTDGLVLYLDAANVKSYPGSGTTWYDLSGNQNDATLIGGPYYTSENNGGMTFDGSNDRATFTSPITAASNQTYEVWTNAIASVNADGGYAYILHNNSINNFIGDSYLTMGIKPTQQYFAAFNGAYTTMDSGITADKSSIIQFVLSWDGSTQKMYINNILKDSEALTSTPQNFSTTTSFGDEKNSTYRMIDGNIYLIRVYNKALTESEINKNFQALRGRFGL